MTPYPKRLIEVDLPIKKISEHSRREKSIRHGHISTLHIWWARRPLAACRAVICAALWVDPADPLCPEKFRRDAAALMKRFFDPMGTDGRDFNDPMVLRGALLNFIADFANWDNSTKKEYLETSRALTQSAHESLGGAPGTKPLVVDPFAGGGSIPLEALRVGADAFASDLNPVAVLLNKVVLEYIPKYGQHLADGVRKWGEWIKQEAEKELAQFYPKDPDGATPIAYLWARTITCEGPGCGAEVPLMRSLWLAKKDRHSVALRIIPNLKEKRMDFEIIENVKASDVRDGTVRRGSATCPCCGFTTHVTSVRKQLKARRGGAVDARMLVVRRDNPKNGERSYRLPNEHDMGAVRKAAEELERRKREHKGELSLVPDEPTPQGGGSGAGRAFSQRNYGMDKFEDLFAPRQALALTTLVRLVQEAGQKLAAEHEKGLATAVQTCLGLTLDRLADFNSSLCILNVVGGRGVVHTFGRQALPIVWDFMETNPFNDVGANWIAGIEAFEDTIKTETCLIIVKNVTFITN
jgi:adenine-specific DNA methylase